MPCATETWRGGDNPAVDAQAARAECDEESIDLEACVSFQFRSWYVGPCALVPIEVIDEVVEIDVNDDSSLWDIVQNAVRALFKQSSLKRMDGLSGSRLKCLYAGGSDRYLMFTNLPLL